MYLNWYDYFAYLQGDASVRERIDVLETCEITSYGVLLTSQMVSLPFGVGNFRHW